MLGPAETCDQRPGTRCACLTWWPATGSLRAVLRSDLGSWPLGQLFVQQGQGVPFLDGAQLLLLRPLELGGVTDLGGGKGVRECGWSPRPGWQPRSGGWEAGVLSVLNVTPAPQVGQHSPLGQSLPCVHSPGGVSGSRLGAVSSPGTEAKELWGLELGRPWSLRPQGRAGQLPREGKAS